MNEQEKQEADQKVIKLNKILLDTIKMRDFKILRSPIYGKFSTCVLLVLPFLLENQIKNHF